jgi:two-component system, NarL family, nitrate/nitrite response regulator NarL
MRLVLCDDNRILCEALASVLQRHGHQVMAITTRVSEAVAAVSAHQPDACLLDVRLPDGSGLDAARVMLLRNPNTKIVVLSCLDDPATLMQAKSRGVAGFLRKDQKPDSIVRAVEVAVGGGRVFGPAPGRQQRRQMAPRHRKDPLDALTPRETEVLRRISVGQTTNQIADEMGVTISTVRSYIKSILAKLGVHSRLQAAAIANQHLSVA